MKQTLKTFALVATLALPILAQAQRADAKTVTVRLKQKRVNVVLEVDDDGCGFDPAKEHKGGMGLRNIRERSAQIGAKLNIVSTPGAGTKISVIVSSDRPSKTHQKRP